MDKDVDGAKMILERLCSARVELRDIPGGTRCRSWDELRTDEQIILTEVVAAIREVVLNDKEEIDARRFREAVERAFAKMTVDSSEDAAVWYTIRAWLDRTKP